MSNKYFAGNKGRYSYCDICGQAFYEHEGTKLEKETGRGGLIVCPNDRDAIDYGLIPYKVSIERSVSWARVNHLNVTNSAPIYDVERSTVEEIGDYEYLATELDEVLTDDDDTWIAL